MASLQSASVTPIPHPPRAGSEAPDQRIRRRPRKPLHELRKELGALVTAEHGIYAASRVLCHSNVATTAKHYTDLKTRPVVNVGGWLTGDADNIVQMPDAEQPAAPAARKRAARK